MTSSLAQTRIKVDRLALIAALEASLGKRDTAYKKAAAAHAAALAQAERELRAALRATKVNGNVECDYNGRATITVYSKTKVPAEPRDTDCELRNTIAVLKLSNETTVPLSPAQYERFFPCEVAPATTRRRRR